MKDNTYQQIGDFIRRQRGDMSLREFSKIAGFHRQTLAKWERGDVGKMGIDDLEVMVRRLNCKLCDVFPELRKSRRRKKR